jgi:hypothetical protein
VVSSGAELLHAQCWLWGQDLNSPHGDLLRASGLERSSFEGARSHRSYYRARLADDRFVLAWGGGLLFGDGSGSLFFPRLRFDPTRLDEVRSLDGVPDLNVVHNRPDHVPARDDPLIPAALGWLAAYERDIPRHAGTAWRIECARRWSEIEEGARVVAASVGVAYEPLPSLPPDGLAEPWRALSAQLSA